MKVSRGTTISGFRQVVPLSYPLPGIGADFDGFCCLPVPGELSCTCVPVSAPRGQRLPITPGILEQLKTEWQGYPSKRGTVMLWAAATMCFGGVLRSGEMVAPSNCGFDSAVHLAYAETPAHLLKCLRLG